MADDRMKNDDRQRNMGTKGTEGQNIGQQSPGRTGQDQDRETGGQHAGQKGQPGQQGGGQVGGQRNNDEDDEQFGAGGAGQFGGQTRGGQNR